MKKMFAFLLTIVMIFSMAFTVFAADGYDAEPEDSNSVKLEDRDFTAYQIFSATNINEDKELGNIAWGSNLNKEAQAQLIAWVNANLIAEGEEKVSDAPGVAAALAAEPSKAKDFAQAAFNLISGDGSPVTNGDTKLNIGYYLIVDETTGTPLTPDVYNLSILKVSDNNTPVTVVSKVSVPEVDKKILIAKGEDFERVNINDASIGDEVKYEIVGTLPSNLADYETYFYKFTDTLSKGLTYKGNMAIAIDGEPIDHKSIDDIQIDVTANEDGTTTITVTFTDIKPMVKADSTVVLTYSATLNKDAEIAGAGNPNEIDLTYSNNPDKSSGGENDPLGVTPKATVKTYTTELTITKTDDKDKKFLPGVEFTLTGSGVNVVLVTEGKFVQAENGTYYKLTDGTYTETAPDDVTSDKYESTTTTYKLETTINEKDSKKEGVSITGTVDEYGTVTFTGLGAGEYKLSETKTLPGYNTIDDIEFEITAEVKDAEDGTKYVAFDSTDENIVLTETNTLAATIVNKKGVILPETGGVGTTVFYVVGAVLVLAAGILLIVKKRMNENI